MGGVMLDPASEIRGGLGGGWTLSDMSSKSGSVPLLQLTVLWVLSLLLPELDVLDVLPVFQVLLWGTRAGGAGGTVIPWGADS